MKFSMARMMAVMGFVSLVLAAAFAMPPVIGFWILTAIAVIIAPQFIWICAFSTKGAARAFCIGVIIAGIPHFVIAVYALLYVGLTWSFSFTDIDSSESLLQLRVSHIAGYLVALTGGLFGVFSHLFVSANRQDSRLGDDIGKEEHESALDLLDSTESRRAKVESVLPSLPK